MDDRERLIETSGQLASAIARRDAASIRGLLAKGFVQRPAGGEAVDAEAFLAGIVAIPGEILFVRVDHLTVDLSGDGAIVTGLQHAQVKIDGALIADRRAFVDWFVREGVEWRLRLAVDMPANR